MDLHDCITEIQLASLSAQIALSEGSDGELRRSIQRIQKIVSNELITATMVYEMEKHQIKNPEKYIKEDGRNE